MKLNYKVAIIGASGLVGRTVLKILEEKQLNYFNYTLFSSKNSAGSKIAFFNTNYVLQELTENSFKKRFDYAIFCAGSDISEKFIPLAKDSFCTCIDNSSLFRMINNIPLVVPEINKHTIKKGDKIIANPNCSTIQAVLALNPLHEKYTLKRVIYSTYQAVSGAGKKGLSDLQNPNINPVAFPYKIYNNCIPHIDTFVDDNYTREEHKLINETRKILNIPNLPVTATAVRIPVENCHSESINIELENEFDLYDVKTLLKNSPGLLLSDIPEKNIYPMPSIANTNNEVFIGRIRRDYSVKNGLNIWVVGDNLRKGAALNAVQILEYLSSQNL